MAGAPVLLGTFHDFPQADDSFEQAVQVGLDDAIAGDRLDRPVELVTRSVAGLPGGTAHAVEEGFRELVSTGVLGVIGPSISDNCLIVRDLAAAAGVPCINCSGGEMTRGPFMFHYQVGSLEEEPLVLARHLADSGARTIGVVHDHSPVGRGYAAWLEEGCTGLGLEITGRVPVSPLAEDVTPALERLRAGGPDAVVYLGLGVAARPVALGLQAIGWDVTVVANSALMFGYARPHWRAGWEGWVYVDTVADDNAARARLRERSKRSAAGPLGVAAYDMGRLMGEALVRAAHLTRDGVRDALERVKRLPAASGHDGTIMGFGQWDHAALKGEFLVLRAWRDGRSVQVGS